MKILAVVHHFPPDVNSTGLLMEKLLGEIANSGHDVDVITTFPHYEGFRTWPEYRGKIFLSEQRGSLRVRRVYSYTSGIKSMRRRLLNYLSFNFFALLAGLFFRRRYDIIFATNGSFFSGLSGWILSRLKRARCVYNLQDLYPEVPISQGQLKGRRQIRALRAIENFMYERADHLAVITPSFQHHLQTKSISPDRVTVVPNFVDTHFIRPLPKENAFSEREGLNGKFVVSHAGNIGYVYDLATLLDSAALLSDYKDILFLVVGDGVAKRDLLEKAERLRLENVRFLPFQPVEDLPYLRAASDIQVSLYKPHSARYSMPSKVYEIMSSRRPLLASADRDSDIWRLVETTNCGICVEPENDRLLADAIIRLYDDEGLREAMGKRGRATAESQFSLATVTQKYLSLFEHLVRS
jgi:colanic acid biosynthesis glycosyl transferase WcaI